MEILKDKRCIFFFFFIIIISTTFLSCCASDEKAWQTAVAENTIESYEEYLEKYPEGIFVEEAMEAIDELMWEKAVEKNTIESYQEYLKKQPEGKYLKEAVEIIKELTWQAAEADNTVDSFRDYLDKYPEGKYKVEAVEAIEELKWQMAEAEDTVQSFEEYLNEYPEGKYVVEARNSIELLHWQEAVTLNTIRSYNTYLESYPQGQFVQEAEKNAAALRTDMEPYDAAIKTGTEDSLEAFLLDYPGHIKEADVQKILRDITEGRDIVDLLNEGKIEIQAQGSGISEVSVSIRKLVPHNLTVLIPVGSFFVSSNRSVQNMVTTAERKVQLTSDDWRNVTVSAACANIQRDIPGSDDTFTVRRSPQQAELVRLMPVLEEAQVDSATRQAAVWIITDNATYSDLGILVSGHFGTGSRRINEQKAAHAMKIIDEAGINIKRKAIWRDRQQIISGLEDGELKTWLQNK